MYEVIVPKENVNDEEVTVVNVFFKNKSKVSKGDSIFEIETTKVNIDIDSPLDGVIHHNIAKGDILDVGAVICKIDDGSSLVSSNNEEKKSEKKNSNLRISKSAMTRAKELGVDLSNIKEGMITATDVEKMAESFSSENITYKDGPKSENSIVIIGGGGHAKTCIDILKMNKNFEIVGIIDSKITPGEEIMGIEVIGDNSILSKLRKDGVKYAINGVGSVNQPKIRKKIYELLKSHGFELPNLVHPSCSLEPSAIYGEGNQFMMGCNVGSSVIVENNCIINSGAVVSHDCVLRDSCHITPGAILAGSVEIGENSIIGMGSTIYIGLKIGANAIVHNGLNIFNNINDDEIAT